MAVYDGFFDAVLDEETGEAGWAYGSGDFTGYFEKVVGSGVCVHNDPDSFKVRFADGAAVVSPGYLFIQGYWLRNDADYTIPLTGDATLAIAAHLNLGRRMIELEAVPMAQAYPDTLVLALVNPAAGTAEDTRYNTDICGVIDTAGELSKKVAWAVNYIDNEIEDKLAAAEADIAAQSALLDAKIAEVQAQVDKITPPSVGTIMFSASQDVGEEWLRCDGSFINEADYPELVAALGKLTPSGDKFQLLSDGEIGAQISNGVLYDGRMWVYSYSTKKLYGVDVNGAEDVKEITLTSESEYFENFVPPSTAYPLCLSIVPKKSGTGACLFLSQIVGNGEATLSNYEWVESFLIFQADFTGNETTIGLSIPFSSIAGGVENKHYFSAERCVPYVVSRMNAGKEEYLCAAVFINYGNGVAEIRCISYSDGEEAKCNYSADIDVSLAFMRQRVCFKPKNLGEVVVLDTTTKSSTTPGSIDKYSVYSAPTNSISYANGVYKSIASAITSANAVNIVGATKVISAFSKDSILWASYAENDMKAVNPGIQFPSAARIFVDGACYLWGKDIYMIFVGTGIIFSRTLEEGDFGYLDTTSVLGTITQFGYLDYSQDEGTLYLLGQDTSNRVKVAKIVLNTLYDYANDGAWLPSIASDGVPAYIKAKGDKIIPDPVEIVVTISEPDDVFARYANVLFEGEPLIEGVYTRTVSKSGTFDVGIQLKDDLTGSSYRMNLYLNSSKVIFDFRGTAGEKSVVSFRTADYLESGVTLKGDRL